MSEPLQVGVAGRSWACESGASVTELAGWGLISEAVLPNHQDTETHVASPRSELGGPSKLSAQTLAQGSPQGSSTTAWLSLFLFMSSEPPDGLPANSPAAPLLSTGMDGHKHPQHWKGMSFVENSYPGIRGRTMCQARLESGEHVELPLL